MIGEKKNEKKKTWEQNVWKYVGDDTIQKVKFLHDSQKPVWHARE
jgi:hypothetical protein